MGKVYEDLGPSDSTRTRSEAIQGLDLETTHGTNVGEVRRPSCAEMYSKNACSLVGCEAVRLLFGKIRHSMASISYDHHKRCDLNTPFRAENLLRYEAAPRDLQ